MCAVTEPPCAVTDRRVQSPNRPVRSPIRVCGHRSVCAVTELPCAVTDPHVRSPICVCGHRTTLCGHRTHGIEAFNPDTCLASWYNNGQLLQCFSSSSLCCNYILVDVVGVHLPVQADSCCSSSLSHWEQDKNTEFSAQIPAVLERLRHCATAE